LKNFRRLISHNAAHENIDPTLHYTICYGGYKQSKYFIPVLDLLLNIFILGLLLDYFRLVWNYCGSKSH
jgi:hypothetical protein